MNHDNKSQWNSSLAFLMSMIGAAVGLGNIWRFSYVLYSNGGGSFFIPYFVAIGLLGIPFLILEYGLGFKFKTSFSNLLHKIRPRFEVIGWVLGLLAFGVVTYYMVILAWDIVYLGASPFLAWGQGYDDIKEYDADWMLNQLFSESGEEVNINEA